MRLLPAIALGLLCAGPAAAANVSSLSLLSEAEQSYYQQVFAYVMENIQPGQHYDWQSYGGRGTIAVGDAFTSKSGTVCRRFSESFQVQSFPGSDVGVGCRRVGRDGWCKLRPGNAMTCAMESPGYWFNMPTVSMPSTGSLPGLPDLPDLGSDMPDGPSPSMPSSNYSTPSGHDVVDTVTGTAGAGAAYVANHAKGWFSDLFR
ncbi:MAG: hypothetical protein KGJ06_05915 [Pseudomonadota bacterium]|nr:hypothetical protein [Pseudomonadota bacterium]